MSNLILLNTRNFPSHARVAKSARFAEMDARRTYDTRMSRTREKFLERYRGVNVDLVHVGQGEHVTGTAERGHLAASDQEVFPRDQVVHLDQQVFHVLRESRHGVQARGMHSDAQHRLVIVLGQQQRAPFVVPHFYGRVDFPARHEHRFPQTRGQAADGAVVQFLAVRNEFGRRILRKGKNQNE